MKHHRLAALVLLAAFALSGCGNDSAVEVYDLTEATYQTSAHGLNASSADSVDRAAADGVFTLADGTFTNHAAGYTVQLPDDLAVVDMGDASYRSTLASDTMRVEIFTQTLAEDTSVDAYLAYSNVFIDNTDDFTLVREDTATNVDINRVTHRLAFDRAPLARVTDDRNHYAIIDIIDEGQVYCFQLSATAPIDEAILDTIAATFDTVRQTADAKDYPRFPRSRDDLTDETRAVLDTYFADDADLTWGVFEPSTGAEETSFLNDLQEDLGHRFAFVLCYSNIKPTYPENIIYDTLTNCYENGSIVELTMQPSLIAPATNPNVVFQILNGDYDDYLHAYAADVARFSHPVLIRPFNEMNGDWCNYSAYWAGRDASIYVELYRYIHQIFEEEGALANTLWIWNPNERSYPDFA